MDAELREYEVTFTLRTPDPLSLVGYGPLIAALRPLIATLGPLGEVVALRVDGHPVDLEAYRRYDETLQMSAGPEPARPGG